MLDIHPMTGRIGAEISGVDLRQPIPDDLAEALRDALHRHLVIVFRRQHLDLAQQKALTRGDPEADEERAHPAVLTDPTTGRRSLFLNPLYVIRVDGLTESESRPILDQIQRHTVRPEFCVRLRWGAGDVAVWDNFATQHYAVNDYHGFRRLMYRTTFVGATPV